MSSLAAWRSEELRSCHLRPVSWVAATRDRQGGEEERETENVSVREMKRERERASESESESERETKKERDDTAYQGRTFEGEEKPNTNTLKTPNKACEILCVCACENFSLSRRNLNKYVFFGVSPAHTFSHARISLTECAGAT